MPRPLPLLNASVRLAGLVGQIARSLRPVVAYRLLRWVETAIGVVLTGWAALSFVGAEEARQHPGRTFLIVTVVAWLGATILADLWQTDHATRPDVWRD